MRSPESPERGLESGVPGEGIVVSGEGSELKGPGSGRLVPGRGLEALQGDKQPLGEFLKGQGMGLGFIVSWKRSGGRKVDS